MKTLFLQSLLAIAIWHEAHGLPQPEFAVLKMNTENSGAAGICGPPHRPAMITENHLGGNQKRSEEHLEPRQVRRTTTTTRRTTTTTTRRTSTTTTRPATTTSVSTRPGSTQTIPTTISTITTSSSILLASGVTTVPSSSSASSSSSTTRASTSTTTSAGPIVTDQAYINTILRHTNQHRSNHSASALTWSSSLAETARKIAQTCKYAHNTTADGGGYGQNIGAGYRSTSMGSFMTDLYNPEMPYYTYYGAEPDINTFSSWGHFTQIVWKGTSSVGCYTADCSATGLANAAGVPPYFTVCNYGPPGNYIGNFAPNVGAPLGNPSIYASYGCPSSANCV